MAALLSDTQRDDFVARTRGLKHTVLTRRKAARHQSLEAAAR
ncbi:hypothetical protein ACLB1N_22555 [Escherichia coli]